MATETNIKDFVSEWTNVERNNQIYRERIAKGSPCVVDCGVVLLRTPFLSSYVYCGCCFCLYVLVAL
jgi:hypothetical protein